MSVFYFDLFCFLGILFTCFCVTAKRTVKKRFPEDIAQQNLIVSNTEGPGEEVTVNQISHPFELYGEQMMTDYYTTMSVIVSLMFIEHLLC